MAIGKNKKLGKKKGARHRRTDPFLKKEWYSVRAPANFSALASGGRSIGRTIATKTAGLRIARDSLIGRIFEISLGDLKKEYEEEAYRKFRLRCEDVQGFNCLTQFWGMDITTDKFRSMVRKWQTLIEAHVDIRTSDGYALRLFAIGFTKKNSDQQRRKTSYAQSSQVRAIRARMIETVRKQTDGLDLAKVVEKLMDGDTIGKEIEKKCQAIYPLQNCMIRKVKMIRSPRVDAAKLSGGEDMTTSEAGTGSHTAVVASIKSAQEKEKAQAKAKKDDDVDMGEEVKDSGKEKKGDSKKEKKSEKKSEAPKESKKQAPSDAPAKKEATEKKEKKQGGGEKKSGKKAKDSQ